jgi:hypothetical protein
MASLKSIKNSLAKRITKEVGKSLDKCIQPDDTRKKTTNTSYMCWLKEHRENFEICTTCNEKLLVDDSGKKTCPRCHAKISSKDVMILAGKYWREMTEEDKIYYAKKARDQ